MPCRAALLISYAVLLFCALSPQVGAQVFSEIVDPAPPVRPGAREPALAALDDGRIAMVWTDVEGSGFAVRVAVSGPDGWTEPGTVIASDDLFVNWADFPSIAALPDGGLAVHWLKVSASKLYAYDVNLALSRDDGATWGPVRVPHRDASAVQHGFASLQPLPDGRLVVVWLDGRAYDAGAKGAGKDAFGNAMQLRTAVLGPDGSLSADEALDIRTCTCCQTSSAVTRDGTVLVAYRDRTEKEIRDISLVRLKDGTWSPPTTVHDDGWEISGCPINGPAVDTGQGRTVVAWFTAANDIPSVMVAFSDDDGASFAPPVRVDRGEGVGRVDVLMLEDGSAIVSWVEWQGRDEGLFVCRVRPGAPCEAPQRIALNTVPGSINFPRMVRGGDGVYLAWTQPRDGPEAGTERGVTIRMVRGLLRAFD